MTMEFWLNAAIASGVALSLLGVGWLTSHVGELRRLLRALEQDTFETGEHVASLNKRTAAPLGLMGLMGGEPMTDMARLAALEDAIVRIDDTLRTAFQQIAADVGTLRAAQEGAARDLDVQIDIKTLHGKLDRLRIDFDNATGAASRWREAFNDKVNKLRSDFDTELGAANKWRVSVSDFLTRPQGFATQESAHTMGKMLDAIGAELIKVNERHGFAAKQIQDLNSHANHTNRRFDGGFKMVADTAQGLEDAEKSIAMIVERINQLATKDGMDHSFDVLAERVEALELTDVRQELSVLHETVAVVSNQAEKATQVANEAINRVYPAAAKANEACEAVKTLTPLAGHLESTRQQLGTAVDKIALQVARLAETQIALRKEVAPVTEITQPTYHAIA